MGNGRTKKTLIALQFWSVAFAVVVSVGCGSKSKQGKSAIPAEVAEKIQEQKTGSDQGPTAPIATDSSDPLKSDSKSGDPARDIENIKDQIKIPDGKSLPEVTAGGQIGGGAENPMASGGVVGPPLAAPEVPVISYSGSTGTAVARGTAMSITPSTLNSQGEAISSCVSSPALPSGLSIDASTCVISGTSLSALISTSYTINATNSVGTGTGSITLQVNDAPSVVNAGDTSLTVFKNAAPTNLALGGYADSDSNQSVLSYVTITSPTKGSLSTLPSSVPASGTTSITYTPATDQMGIDSFSYKVCDAAGVAQACSSVVTVSISISEVSDPPAVATAGPTTASATEDTAATITLGSYTDSDNTQESLTKNFISKGRSCCIFAACVSKKRLNDFGAFLQ
jgi:Bacterial Ig domain